MRIGVLDLRLIVKATSFIGLAFVGLVGCSEPPLELKMTEEYASKIRIEGFRKSDQDEWQGDQMLRYVGPANVDLAHAISAPGFNFSEASSIKIESDRVFEYLAESLYITYKEMKCRLTIKKYKVDDSVGLLEACNLTEKEIADAQSGAKILLELITFCRKG